MGTQGNFGREQGNKDPPGTLSLLVKNSQTQTTVESNKGGLPVSRVNANPDDDDEATISHLSI